MPRVIRKPRNSMKTLKNTEAFLRNAIKQFENYKVRLKIEEMALQSKIREKKIFEITGIDVSAPAPDSVYYDVPPSTSSRGSLGEEPCSASLSSTAGKAEPHLMLSADTEDDINSGELDLDTTKTSWEKLDLAKTMIEDEEYDEEEEDEEDETNESLEEQGKKYYSDYQEQLAYFVND